MKEWRGRSAALDLLLDRVTCPHGGGVHAEGEAVLQLDLLLELQQLLELPLRIHLLLPRHLDPLKDEALR